MTGEVIAGESSPATLEANVVKRLSSGFKLNVALAAPPGISILFGASGSGKTTLLNCISGLLAPDQGRITVSGRILFDSEARLSVDVARRSIGYVFQSLALFAHLNVIGNIEYGLASLTAQDRCQRTQEILQAFRIAHLAHRRPGEISGGERQRVALARSLVTKPSAMLLDEPLTALDLATQSFLIDDLRTWNKTHQIPVLYVTHSPREVYALAERVIVLEQGRVLAEGAPQQVLRAPREETIAGLAGVENVFDATVVAIHEAQGTMTCRIAGTELEAPLGKCEVGSSVRIAVHAGDILLASEKPIGLSARNVLPGRLLTLRQEGVAIHAYVDCSMIWHVKLTPGAVQALALEPGQEVWMVVKTYSLHLLHG